MTNYFSSQQGKSVNRPFMEDPQADVALLQYLPPNLQKTFAEQLFSTRSMQMEMKKCQLLQMGIADPLAGAPSGLVGMQDTVDNSTTEQSFARNNSVTPSSAGIPGFHLSEIATPEVATYVQTDNVDHNVTHDASSNVNHNATHDMSTRDLVENIHLPNDEDENHVTQIKEL